MVDGRYKRNARKDGTGSAVMTRTFNQKIRCPKCNYEHTAETDFERWVRNNRELDSSAGIVRFDLDVLLHRYKVPRDGKGDRNLQFMMFIEVKSMLAEPSDAQRDTLSALNQILRNRKENKHQEPRRQSELAPVRVHSKMLNRDVRLWLLGGHLLQFSGTCPDNSQTILWDGKPISAAQLVELLLFVRDPDRPHLKMDYRRRYRQWTNAPTLFD